MRLLRSSAAVVAILAAGSLHSPLFAAETHPLFLSGFDRSADQVLAQADQPAPAEGADAAPADSADAGNGGDDEDPVDPRATDALYKMGDELVTLQEFALRIDGTVEQVMDSGQKIQFGGTALYRVRRPDRLRLDTDPDTGFSSSYYDGKTLTLSTPAKKVYGSTEAKPTIGETVDWAEDTYGLEFPIADLWDWGTDNAPVDEIVDATSVGTARIDGVLCAHFAYRTEETDWEIWIETGDRPLPLKFAVVDKTQDSLPRFEATLHWSTSEHFADDVFLFSPTADAKKIPLAPLNQLAKLQKQE